MIGAARDDMTLETRVRECYHALVIIENLCFAQMDAGGEDPDLWPAMANLAQSAQALLRPIEDDAPPEVVKWKPSDRQTKGGGK